MNSVRELAVELATELQSDIEKCATREEHVRVSARANVAVQLLMRIDEILGHETEA